MNVIVTRDSWGIEIWKDGSDLVYDKPFTSIFTPGHMGEGGSTLEVDSENTSGIKGWPFGKKIYSRKKVKKTFPYLFDEINIGEKKIGELKIII